MLSEEEKQRIEDEERFRHQVRKQLEQEDAETKSFPFGCGCLTILLIILLVGLVLDSWPDKGDSPDSRLGFLKKSFALQSEMTKIS